MVSHRAKNRRNQEIPSYKRKRGAVANLHSSYPDHKRHGGGGPCCRIHYASQSFGSCAGFHFLKSASHSAVAFLAALIRTSCSLILVWRFALPAGSFHRDVPF